MAYARPPVGPGQVRGEGQVAVMESHDAHPATTDRGASHVRGRPTAAHDAQAQRRRVTHPHVDRYPSSCSPGLFMTPPVLPL